MRISELGQTRCLASLFLGRNFMTVGKKEERITGGSMLITRTNLSVINTVIYIMDLC